MAKPSADLKEAIEAWVRAEISFRLGPHAYSAAAQDWIVQAEEDLRKALTGERSLRGAAKVLGIGIPKDRPKLTKRPITSKIAKRSPSVWGLFDRSPKGNA